MAVNHRSEATFGILTFLLAGGAIALPLLLGTLLVGSDAVADAIGAHGLNNAINTGAFYQTALVGFFVALPLVAIGVATMMGRRAADTGNPVKGAAAMTALFGGLLAWVDVAIGMLLSAAVVSDFYVVFDLVTESLVFTLVGLLPMMGLAALMAGMTYDAFADIVVRAPPAAAAVPAPSPSPYEPTPAQPTFAPEPAATQADDVGDELVEFGVDCPRCQAHFVVSGTRPLRIECPQCGKTGTIR